MVRLFVHCVYSQAAVYITFLASLMTTININVNDGTTKTIKRPRNRPRKSNPSSSARTCHVFCLGNTQKSNSQLVARGAAFIVPWPNGTTAQSLGISAQRIFHSTVVRMQKRGHSPLNACLFAQDVRPRPPLPVAPHIYSKNSIALCF